MWTTGDTEKEQAFSDLQEYLLSDEVQNEIQRTGRRTGYEGVSAENADVFRADWGVQPDRVLSPLPDAPPPTCSLSCLDLYQTQFPQALPDGVLPGLLGQHVRRGPGRRWWRP